VSLIGGGSSSTANSYVPIRVLNSSVEVTKSLLSTFSLQNVQTEWYRHYIFIFIYLYTRRR